MVAERTAGPVLARQRDGVLLLTLNRPDRANALTREMEHTYRELLGTAAGDAGVRAVVVTGAGRAFCAGAEFADLDDLVTDPGGNPFDGPAFRAPAGLRKPLIAAVNGACAGLGLLEALYADVRFVAEDAKVTTAFARRGVAAEQGVTFLLSRVVGEAHARDLLLSSRTIDGVEAARMGFATRAVPRADVVGVALDYARDIAAHCGPTAVATMKEQFAELVHARYEEDAERSALRLRESLAGPEFPEGVASYLERRPPRFDGVAVGWE